MATRHKVKGKLRRSSRWSGIIKETYKQQTTWLTGGNAVVICRLFRSRGPSNEQLSAA